MKKILFICAGNLVNRGVEKYITNLCNSTNSKQVSFDVLTAGYCKNDELKNIITMQGGKIIELKLEHLRRNVFYRFYKELNRFLQNNKYELVEVQTGDMAILGIASHICYKNDIKHIMLHTHNSQKQGIRYVINRCLYFRYMKRASAYCACSKLAGIQSFPKEVHDKIIVIPNSIDIEKYKYNETIRNQAREEYMLDCNTVVLGHIGAFTKQKNHIFLLKLLVAIRNQYNDKEYKLLLIGSGELKNKIFHMAEKMDLLSNIIFISDTNDVPKFLNMMDVFLFPSIWEGLGISVIEAQAAGLPCVVSEVIPEEAHIIDSYDVIDTFKVEQWIDSIKKYEKTVTERTSANNLILDSKYSFKELEIMVDELYKKYL